MMTAAEIVAKRENYFDTVLRDNDYTFIAGDILLSDSIHADLFFKNLSESIRRTGKQIWMLETTLVGVCEQLCSLNEEERRLAGLADQRVSALLGQNLANVKKDDQEQGSFARGFLSVRMGDTDSRFCLLTGDRALADEVTGQMSALGSVKASPIRAYNIDSYGFIARFKETEAANGAQRPSLVTPRPGSFRTFSQEGEPFSRNAKFENVPELSEGSVVTAFDGRCYKLGRRLDCGNEGSEGAVFAIEGNDGLAAKILMHPDILKFQKIRMLCQRAFDIEGVAFPEVPLIVGKAFAGCLMPRVSGCSLEDLLDADFQMDAAPEFTRVDYVRIARRFLEIVRALHDHGIMIGDVTPRNIIIGKNERGEIDSSKVYLIDTDSVQIGDGKTMYPSEGITRDYAPPELLTAGWNPGTIRDFEGERFSVALLTAQIVLCGIHPFRSQNESDSGETYTIPERIMAGVFPYGCGESRREAKSPPLADRMWSQLPAGAKKALHDALSGRSEDRPGVGELLRQMAYYESWIVDPKSLEKFGPEIQSLEPEHYKRMLVSCSRCGREFDAANESACASAHDGKLHLCPECAAEPQTVCSCGEVILTRGEALRGKKSHLRCRKCQERWRAEIADFAVCEDCGMPFEITNAETAAKPRYCPACAAAHAAQPAAPAPVQPTAPVRPAAAPVQPASSAAPSVGQAAKKSSSKIDHLIKWLSI